MYVRQAREERRFRTAEPLEFVEQCMHAPVPDSPDVRCFRLHCYLLKSVPTMSDLFDTADSQLFHNILANPNHVLNRILPPVSCATKHYNLQTRTNNRQLPAKETHLKDCNFINKFYKYYIQTFILDKSVIKLNIVYFM